MEFFRRRAEEKLNEAVANGEFDNLPNQGQMIDYQSYLDVPVAVRMMFKLLKDAKLVPAEVEIMNELAALSEKLKSKALTREQRERIERAFHLKRIEREMRKANREE
jgi:hypothetical protein